MDIIQKLCHGELAFIQNRRIAFVLVQLCLWIGILVLAANELVQVAVGPAQGHLQNGVEPAEGRSPRDPHPAPNGWLASA